MRLAVLVTHPVQYFAPIFRELAQQPDLEVKVFFGCNHGVIPQKDPNFGVVFQWDCEPTVGFEHEFLSTGSVDKLKGFAGIKLAVKAATTITSYRPDAVLIFAYTPVFITVSTLLLYLARHKLLLRADTSDKAIEYSPFKKRIRESLFPFYYSQFSHFFPIGTDSMDHYLQMGVHESQLTQVNYAIDTDFFKKQVDYWLPQRDILRATAGIKSDDHVLMFCGKMFSKKNPLIIPEALAMLSPEERKRIWFLAVGDGELRYKFEAMVKEHLGERVIFTGFKNQSELGRYYAIANTLILPSRTDEVWGLVVNEALQFGLRAIVSDKVASGRDLLKEDNRGFIFPSNDATALAKGVSQLSIHQHASNIDFDELPHPKQLAQAIYLQIKTYD